MAKGSRPWLRAAGRLEVDFVLAFAVEEKTQIYHSSGKAAVRHNLRPPEVRAILSKVARRPPCPPRLGRWCTAGPGWASLGVVSQK